jgi:tetratricopeptide (TPR) repeat protein
MAAQGFDEPADALLTQSIEVWKRTQQPPDELAALYKTRGTVRQRQKLFDAALADYTESLRLVQQNGANQNPTELQRTFVLRARVQEALERWKFAEADLTAAIDRLDELDAIESTNPFLFASRGAARSRLGDFSGAAEDALRAEDEFKMIGDRVRRLSSAADSALYLYGADRIPEAVEKMRYVFQNKGLPSSNNPDDLPLIQELSRKDAELHLAYAAHLFGADRRTDADTQVRSRLSRERLSHSSADPLASLDGLVAWPRLVDRPRPSSLSVCSGSLGVSDWRRSLKMASLGLRRSERSERQTRSGQTKRAPCSGSAPRPSLPCRWANSRPTRIRTRA